MDENFGIELNQMIIANLMIELSADGKVLEDVLVAKVDDAIREIHTMRNYPENYTQEMIDKDLFRHFTIIKNLALYDYRQVGAEFHQEYSENGIKRNYVSREKVLKGVRPICRLV